MLYRLLITILSVSFSVLSVSAIADTSSQRIARNTVDTPVQLVRACSEECAELSKRFTDERAILERQADRQYAQLKDTFNWSAGGVSILIALGLGLFYFLFGRTGKEVREQIDHHMKNEIDRLVAKDLEPVREKVFELQKEVEQLRGFKYRRIIWLALTGDDIDGTQAAFNDVGLVRVDAQTPMSSDDIDVADCHLVILSYDGTPLAKSLLQAVADQLINRTPTIHLVIYTYRNGSTEVRLGKEEFEILANLRWFSMANFPSTLIAQVVSLVRGSVSTIRR
ncbi:MAG: hypothetical protein P4M14_01110 [Gammaproteobacteria bacterium]|nr:hypothetical protein [Gammaproteobacteria bacterium]